MTFKKPFLTVGSSASIVAKGDDVYIKGTAEEKPASVSYYIFGTNYFANGTISVENDGNFEKKLTLSTQDAGQYFVVVEHPMENGKFDGHKAHYNAVTSTFTNTATLMTGNNYTVLYIPNAEYIGGDIHTTDVNKAVNSSQSSFIVDGKGKL